MKHSTECYVELYKRGEYKDIPLGRLPDDSFFYMTPKQISAIEAINDDVSLFVGYGGSARSGKTILECFAATFDCLAYSGIAWGIARKELVNLKRTVLKTLFNLFEFYGIEKDIDYRYNQQLNIITFNNGSEIFLIDSAHKPTDPLFTRFGGYELTRCAHDESNEAVYEAIRILFTRTGWRNNKKHGLKKKMFETFNPDKGHVYRRYYKPYSSNNELEHIKFIPALPSDNPNPTVKEWIVDMIKEGHEITIQRLIHGNFDYDDDPTSLCSFNDITAIFDNDHVFPGERYITADIARLGSDKAIILVWEGWVVIDGKVMDISRTTEIQDVINLFRRKYQIAHHKAIADEDGVGGGVIDNCGIKGFVNNARPFMEDAGDDYIKPNYNNLQSQCGYYLADKINDNALYFKWKIPTRYREEIEEELGQLKTWKADADGKVFLLPKDKIKENIGRSPDWRDVLLMRSYFDLDQSEAEISVEIYNR